LSRRLARNTQIILREEAMLGRVADAAGGSYAVEALTDALATQAWKLMQQFEDAGGFSRMQSVVSSTLRLRTGQRREAVASRRLVLTGTNRFADASERVGSPGGAARAARGFEELRLRTQRFVEGGGRAPRILLAEIGDAKMRAARSQFLADLLACAGLAAECRRFASAAEIAGGDAELIVLCSSDAEYAAIAGELFAALRERGKVTPVMIAGNPETADELRAMGVSEFIHLRSEPLEVLAGLQQRLGIKG